MTNQMDTTSWFVTAMIVISFLIGYFAGRNSK